MSDVRKRHQARLDKLRELDAMPARKRWHALKLLTDEVVLELYITCVNGYGSDSPVGEDLARAVRKWLDRQKSRQDREMLQKANEEHVLKSGISNDDLSWLTGTGRFAQ